MERPYWRSLTYWAFWGVFCITALPAVGLFAWWLP